jgi:nitrogen fixation/metabolism regulation signal transduction histidine kinase
MRRLLTPFLPFLGLGLLAFMFFVKLDMLWEKVNVFWLMAFLFHVPLLLFLIAAVMVKIIALVEKKDMGCLDKKKLIVRKAVYRGTLSGHPF